MSDDIEQEAFDAYKKHLDSEHLVGAWPMFFAGFKAARTPGPATAKLIEELERWHNAEDPLHADEYAYPFMLGSEVVALLAELGRNPPPLKPYLGDEAATKGAGG